MALVNFDVASERISDFFADSFDFVGIAEVVVDEDIDFDSGSVSGYWNWFDH